MSGDAFSRPWEQVREDRSPAKARLVASEIVAQLEGLTSIEGSSSHSPIVGRAITSDGHGGIAILGERGSGKSTVLHAVCARIESRGKDIVLPVIYPELFRETDSVLGTLLASLWEWAQASDTTTMRSREEDEKAIDLMHLILDAANIYAMARTPAKALENSSLGQGYIDEAVAITRSSARLHRILSEVTNAVRETSGGGLLILPIDDADLSPLGVTGIMRDLRIIGSISGLMPIACASESDLRRSWVQEQKNDDMSPHQLGSFRRFTEKLFPYRYRFEIEPLLTDERVDFTPIGAKVSVSTISREFDKIASAHGGDSPFLALRNRDPKFALVNPLPPNPRALIQVWDSLVSAVQQADATSISLALRRVIQIVSEPADDATDANGLPPFVTVTPSPTGGSSLYKADFATEGLDLYIGADRYSEPQRQTLSTSSDGPSSQARVEVRKFEGVYVSLRRSNSDESRKRSGDELSGTRERLSPTVASSLLTVQEILARTNMIENGRHGPLYVGHDDYLFLQRVELAGLRTDNMFVTLPDLTTYSSIQAGAEYWNKMVDLTRASQLDAEMMLSLSLATTLALVQGEKATIQRPESNYIKLFREITETFLGFLRISKLRRTEEQRCFIEWYIQGPPLHWHNALLPHSILASTASTWFDACSHLAPSDTVSRPMALLKIRLEEILRAAETGDATAGDHVWVAGYLSALAGRVEQSLYERLAGIYPLWQQRWTIVRAGSTSARLTLNLGLTDQATTFSPYPTQSSIDLLDQARTLLRRLRNAGAQGEIMLQTEQ